MLVYLDAGVTDEACAIVQVRQISLHHPLRLALTQVSKRSLETL